MKIRIKKKGLPKAQFGPPGQPLTMAPGFVPQNPFAWMNSSSFNPAESPMKILPPSIKQNGSSDEEIGKNFEMSQRGPMDYQMLHRTMWTSPHTPVPKPAGTDPRLIKQDPRFNVETPWEDVHDLTGANEKSTKKSVGKKSMWADIGMITRGVAAGINAVSDQISDRRKQRMHNQTITNSMLNPTPTQRTSGDRGDYTVNEGFFRPDDMQTPNKGMFAGLYYPQRNYMQFGGGIIPDEISMPMILDMLPMMSPKGLPQDLSGQPTSVPIDSNEKLVFPLDEYRVTSGFGNRRAPTKGASTNHNGVDLGVPVNTPVKAPMVGKVVKAWFDEKNGGGNSMVIEHPDGTRTGYAHLNKFVASQGDIVNPGDVIALSGNTGRSTGPHLHLTVRNPDGIPVDPLGYFGYDPKNKKFRGTERSSLEGSIGAIESGGRYDALPFKTDGSLASSAVGKYQFLWNKHKDWIKQVTGVSSKDAFRNNPDAQEMAFRYWNQNTLTPWANKIKRELGVDISLDEIKKKIHFAGPQGAYDYFATGKETIDAFGTTTSSYGNRELGGVINQNDMKLRITGVPNMEYGGQMGYGFDIGGRRVYTDMSEDKSEATSRNISEDPDPDSPYILEAEGRGDNKAGETLLAPDGRHSNIVGKRHSQGGVKLTAEQAPEGSFIFSDTARMRIGGDIVKAFGKSPKKKYTPAELAKQYDTNRYKAILDDKYADPLSKETAAKMLENYQNKLAQIALLQESKKGFADGIPQIAMPYLQSMMGAIGPDMGQSADPEEEPMARYGGTLDHYQIKGEVKTKAKKASSKDELKGWESIGSEDGRDYYQRRFKIQDAKPGSDAVYKTGTAPGRGSVSFNRAFANARAAGLKTFLWNGKSYNTNLYDSKSNKVLVTPAVAPQDEKWDEEYMYLDGLINPVVTTTQEKKADNPVNFTNPKPGYPGQMASGYGGRGSSGYLLPDKMGMLASMMLPPKKFFPYVPTMRMTMPNPTFEDWRARAAGRQAMVNTAANVMGAYGSPQGLGANLSYMAGQQADGLIQDIAATENRNVGIANQFAGVQADVVNKNMEMDAKRAQALYDGNTILNQQNRNDWRQYIDRNVKSFQNAWGNRTNMNLLDGINRNFYIDRNTGRMILKPGADPFDMAFGNPSGSRTSLTPEKYLTEIARIRRDNPGISDTQINQYMQMNYPELNRGRGQQDIDPITAAYLAQMRMG